LERDILIWKRILSVLIILSISVTTSKAQFDTAYVHLTKNKFSVIPLFEYYKSNMNIIEFAPEANYPDNQTGRSFSAKSNLYVGIGLSFQRFGFSLSFQLPQTDIPELKESRSMSFIGGFAYRKFYAEMHYLNYNGFLEKTFTFENDSIIEQTRIAKETEYQQLGGELYYFTARKYNYDANFKNYNIQKKSAISPVGILGLNYYSLYASAENFDTLQEVDINRTVRIFSAKLGAGLAGTLVYHERWFAGGVAIFGLSVNRNQLIGGENNKPSVNVLPFSELNFAMGYNSLKFYIALNYMYNNNRVYFFKNKIGIHDHYVTLKFGYRFNSKFLGKAAKYL